VDKLPIRSGIIHGQLEGGIPIDVVTWHEIDLKRIWIHSKLIDKTYKQLSITVQVTNQSKLEPVSDLEKQLRLQLAALENVDSKSPSLSAAVFRNLQTGRILDLHTALISEQNISRGLDSENKVHLVKDINNKTFLDKPKSTAAKTTKLNPPNPEMGATSRDSILISGLYSDVSKTGYKKPAQRTADLLGLYVSTVYVAARVARKKGWLTSLGFGKPGGKLTELGEQEFKLINGQEIIDGLIRKYGRNK
jgi:hypothetical protein